jgi:hypothetical protein
MTLLAPAILAIALTQDFSAFGPVTVPVEQVEPGTPLRITSIEYTQGPLQSAITMTIENTGSEPIAAAVFDVDLLNQKGDLVTARRSVQSKLRLCTA